MKIITANTKILLEKTGKEMAELLKKYRNKDIFLLLAGGSCVAALEFVPSEVLGPNLTIGPLDDRFSFDPKINNWSVLQKTDFYKRAVEADVNTADILPTKGESKEELAERYEDILQEWRAEFPKGIMVGLFGIGEDGHIGSVMPFPSNPKLFAELFENEKRSFVAYDAGKKNVFPLRVTTTLSFMRENIKAGVCYAVGIKKRDAIGKLLADKGDLFRTPARIFREIPDVALFTDQL